MMMMMMMMMMILVLSRKYFVKALLRCIYSYREMIMMVYFIDWKVHAYKNDVREWHRHTRL